MPSKRSTLPVLVAVAAVAVALSLPTATPAATRCTTSFTVLHDDSVGALSIPKGQYFLTTNNLTCQKASELFTRFLDDFDGLLPGAWVVDAATASFVNGATGQSFSLGTARPPTPTSRGLCPGTFTVEHNDRIGALSLRAGRYKITTHKLSCSFDATQLAFFLFRDFAGTLPRPWKLNLAKKRFSRGSAYFSIKYVDSKGPSGGGGVHPNLAITCPKTVSLAAPTTLGSLIIPAGSYYINVFSNLSCSSATTLFKSFVVAGALPAQWTLEPETATFLRGKEGFQIEPVS